MTAKYGRLLGFVGLEHIDNVVVSDDVFVTQRDTTLNGNVIDNDSTVEGSLSVLHFVVEGDAGFYRPSSNQVLIGGVGTIVLRADGSFVFTPLAEYVGPVPTINTVITNGVQVRVSSLHITVDGVVEEPPAEDPPVEDPPTEDPPAEDPPVEDPPTEDPPVEDPPAEDPPAEEPPIEYPTAPPTSSPMFSDPYPTTGIAGEAAYNFGLTYMSRLGDEWGNGVNVSSPPYSSGQGLFDLNTREPWLYDRATSVYVLYLRTGDTSILDHAIYLADLYMSHVHIGSGNLASFDLAGTDVKYLYPIIGVWYEQVTGSSIHREKSIALYNQALLSFSKTYNPGSLGLWTERNASYAIMACLSAYWLYWNAGNREAAEKALQDAWDYFDMVEGMSVGTGAPLHRHDQHEGSDLQTLITSPWMGALLVEAVLQLHRTSPDNRLVSWIAGYGEFLLNNAFYVTDGSEHGPMAGLRLPAYLAPNGGTPTMFMEGELIDMEHAQDVAALMKKVVWAKTVLGQPTGPIETLLAELEQAAHEVFLYWTRETVGYPKYRVNPPRKYAWWFRNDYSHQSLFFSGLVPSKPLLVDSVTIIGSAQSGSVLSAVPGNWAGRPTPTNSYQWLKDGVEIAGATTTTYTTTSSDSGSVITCRETAVNPGGSASVVSNGIQVVPAGAPDIIEHPTAAAVSVGGQAQFSAACLALPEAAFQWQESVDSGNSWAPVSGGSGASGFGNSTTYATQNLTESDNGKLYRCSFSNSYGTAYTLSAPVVLTMDQGSGRFNGPRGAEIGFGIGGLGESNFVIESLVMFEAAPVNAGFIGTRNVYNGREVMVRCNNAFPGLFGVGDSQTGTATWEQQPPLGVWLYVTLQSSPDAGGTLRASWALAEDLSAPVHAITRNNGIEHSVTSDATYVGGPSARFQYVRGRTGYLSDDVVASHRQLVDVSGWDFWWRFYDGGSGQLAVEDLTGNGRVPVLTDGTLTTGPVVPGIV